MIPLSDQPVLTCGYCKREITLAARTVEEMEHEVVMHVVPCAALHEPKE